MRAVMGSFVLLTPGAAHAQVAVDWEIGASLSLGVTDNIGNTPTPEEGAAEDTPVPETDGFGTVSPSIRLQFETPGATQTLNYSFGYTFNVLHSEANNYFNGFGYGIRAPLSPTVEFTGGTGINQSTLATLQLVAPAGAGAAQPTEGSDDIVVTLNGGAAISAQVAETVSFSTAASGIYGITFAGEGEVQGPRTFVGSLAFNVTKQFLRDRVGVEQSNDLQRTLIVVADQPEPDVTLTVLHRARATWAHDFSPEVTTQLGAGIVVGYDPAGEFTPVPHPSGAASLTYSHPVGSLALSVAHDALPNVLLGEVSLSDIATLNALFSLPKGFDVSGSGGVTGSRTFLAEGGFGVPNISFFGDAAVGWVPAEVPIRCELRYQFNRQQSLRDEEGGLPTIQRHAGILSTEFAWPGSPTAGGGGFVAVPAPTASPDIIGRQAPQSDRAKAENEEKSDAAAEGRSEPKPEE